MIIDIATIGEAPIRLNGAQIVVYNDEGTPIMVAGQYGIEGACKVAHAGDADFQQTLRAFGVDRHEVVAEEIRLSPVPAGARVIRSPIEGD
jgi:hypothetical protein